MKVGNIVPYIYRIILVIRISTLNIGFSERKISKKSKITNLYKLHLRLISYSTVSQIGMPITTLLLYSLVELFNSYESNFAIFFGKLES